MRWNRTQRDGLKWILTCTPTLTLILILLLPLSGAMAQPPENGGMPGNLSNRDPLEIVDSLSRSKEQVPPEVVASMRSVVQDQLQLSKATTPYAKMSPERRRRFNQCVTEAINNIPRGEYNTPLQQSAHLKQFESNLSLFLKSPTYSPAHAEVITEQLGGLADVMVDSVKKALPGNDEELHNMRGELITRLKNVLENDQAPILKEPLSPEAYQAALQKLREEAQKMNLSSPVKQADADKMRQIMPENPARLILSNRAFFETLLMKVQSSYAQQEKPSTIKGPAIDMKEFKDLEDLQYKARQEAEKIRGQLERKRQKQEVNQELVQAFSSDMDNIFNNLETNKKSTSIAVKSDGKQKIKPPVQVAKAAPIMNQPKRSWLILVWNSLSAGVVIILVGMLWMRRRSARKGD